MPEEAEMRKLLKWLGIALAGLVGLLALAAAGLSIAFGARLNRTHDIPVEAIPIPTDAAALARGEFLVTTICTSCHGTHLSGATLLNEPRLATVYAANITGLSRTHSDADLIRAIRHAVGQDGRQLIAMPADLFINFSAEDLGAIIAYLKTVPRLGEARPEPQFAFPGRVMLAAGAIGEPFPAEHIDHNKPFPEMPPIGANVAYGAYLAGWCTACHGADLHGAQPVFDTAAPFAPDLTQGGELRGWTEDDFLTALHAGMTPSGRQIEPEYMPWKEFGQFDDEELRGLWMYLQTLPPQESGNR
jgi:mono/diheme cytochrome c family protein